MRERVGGRGDLALDLDVRTPGSSGGPGSCKNRKAPTPAPAEAPTRGRLCGPEPLDRVPAAPTRAPRVRDWGPRASAHRVPGPRAPPGALAGARPGLRECCAGPRVRGLAVRRADLPQQGPARHPRRGRDATQGNSPPSRPWPARTRSGTRGARAVLRSCPTSTRAGPAPPRRRCERPPSTSPRRGRRR